MTRPGQNVTEVSAVKRSLCLRAGRESAGRGMSRLLSL